MIYRKGPYCIDKYTDRGLTQSRRFIEPRRDSQLCPSHVDPVREVKSSEPQTPLLPFEWRPFDFSADTHELRRAFTLTFNACDAVYAGCEQQLSPSRWKHPVRADRGGGHLCLQEAADLRVALRHSSAKLQAKSSVWSLSAHTHGGVYVTHGVFLNWRLRSCGAKAPRHDAMRSRTP